MRRLISGELTIYSVVSTSPEPLHCSPLVPFLEHSYGNLPVTLEHHNHNKNLPSTRDSSTTMDLIQAAIEAIDSRGDGASFVRENTQRQSSDVAAPAPSRSNAGRLDDA
jgi:hypothetical protein